MDIELIDSKLKNAVSGKYSTYQLRQHGLSGKTIGKIKDGTVNTEYLSWKTVKILLKMEQNK